MANARRGEVAAVLDGRPFTLCLTLGALAELERAYAADDLVALLGRFAGGRLSAADVTRVLGAGLRGAGAALSDEEVAAMRVEGGAGAAARVAAELLRLAFGAETEGDARPPAPQAAGRPSPGTR